MAQIFHPSFNTLSRVSIFGSVFILGAVAWGTERIFRSSYVTQVNVAREQPIPFSHKHHVAGLGLDCRFCHTSVEDSSFAGIPPSKTCMGCHSVVWNEAPMLEPLRESYQNDTPIEWNRVHDLPDFVYFDHSIHLAKGVGCTTCHGQVDQMPLMWRENTLNMNWCTQCHRDPVAEIRPLSEVFSVDWDPTSIDRSEREKLALENDVQSLMNCTICHR